MGHLEVIQNLKNKLKPKIGLALSINIEIAIYTSIDDTYCYFKFGGKDKNELLASQLIMKTPIKW